MQTVDEEPLETIHLYVVREEAARPSILPVFFAVLTLLVLVSICVLSPYQQPEEHKTIRVPAVFLPPRTFTAVMQIIATGIYTYPATYAQGFLTFSNGSVIGLSIPQGFTVDGAVTDKAVYVPPANADGFGISTVSAHLLTSGINKSTLAINVVVGASLFIRNLSPFTGGKDAYSVKVVTPQDRQTAIDHARTVLTQSAQIQAILAHPCKESRYYNHNTLQVAWQCQFASYPNVPGMKVAHVKLVGKTLFIDVVFVSRPRIIQFK